MLSHTYRHINRPALMLHHLVMGLNTYNTSKIYRYMCVSLSFFSFHFVWSSMCVSVFNLSLNMNLNECFASHYDLKSRSNRENYRLVSTILINQNILRKKKIDIYCDMWNKLYLSSTIASIIYRNISSMNLAFEFSNERTHSCNFWCNLIFKEQKTTTTTTELSTISPILRVTNA